MVPIVRYMILCSDWHAHGQTGRQVTIVGLLWTIPPPEGSVYPMVYSEFCVYLALTGVRGRGEAHIACVAEESGSKVFETPKRIIPPRHDPLEVVGVPFRIRNCVFPLPGHYAIQFWYDAVLVEERPLKLR